MNNIWSIYALASPVDGVIRYVGKAKYPYRRLAKHLRLNKNTHNSAWLRKLTSEGLVPVLTILETGEGENWREAERKWIASFPEGQLTNHCEGGEGGLRPGAEGDLIRLKLSIAVKESWKTPARKEILFEKWRNPSFRERMKLVLEGNRSSTEFKERQSNGAKAHCNKLWSNPEFRQQASERMKEFNRKRRQAKELT